MQEGNMQAVAAPQKSGASVILIVLLVVAFLAAAGLGFWAFSLNGKLTDTQAQLADTQMQLQDLQGKHTSLQSEHTTLQGDFDKLTAENTQTKADLEKSQADAKKLQSDLSSTQADLKAANEADSAKKAKLDKLQAEAAVLEIIYISEDYDKLEDAVKAVDDPDLSAAYAALDAAKSDAQFVIAYAKLINAIMNAIVATAK